MQNASTEARAYRLADEIWIDAPPERVFRALTDPEEVPAWWSVPGAYRTTEAEIDLRVGGRYRFAGTSERMGSFAVEGEYRVVDPPRRLSYTWKPSWNEDAANSVVTFSLEERDGGTRLRLEHSAFRSRASRDEHAGGWPPVLEGLRAYAEGHGGGDGGA